MTVYNDGRMHSTVYNKRDPRLNNLLRRFRKSDIIKIYDIDCLMLFRVMKGNMQFDMINNYKPFMLFEGNIEGVYLDPRSGLLFPNNCDQLDFRSDFQVDSQVEYDLNELEISVLAKNGLHHHDYELQGKAFGHILEIPCKIDYFAIARTPITFIAVHDQFNIRTSTAKTGYKTLVSTFIPYDLQRHNLEEHAKIVDAPVFDANKTAIRQRDIYDTKPVSFENPPSTRPREYGADFVEVATSRMQERLQSGMSKGDSMGTINNKPMKAVDDIVKVIEMQSEKQRANAVYNVEGDASKIDAAELDSKLNDMANRMIMTAANSIPVKVDPIADESLVKHKLPNQNDETMTTPITKVKDVVGEVGYVDSDQAKENIDQKTEDVHDMVQEAEKTAEDIANKALSRKEKLELRRKQKEMQKQAIIQAGKEDFDKKPDAAITEKNSSMVGGKQSAKSKLDAELKNDILNSENLDFDALLDSVKQ